MINHIFRDLLDQGVLVFVDDLMMHARTRQEHDKIVLEVLWRLRDNGPAGTAGAGPGPRAQV